jgi:hypothetical protein
MRLRVALWGVVMSFCVLAAPPVLAQANLIVNGSFESAGAGAGGEGAGRFVYVAGQQDTQINGWTLSGIGDVYIHHSPDVGNALGANFNSAQNGSQYLDLSGGIGGGTSGQHATIYQDFATVPQQTYELTFFIGAALAPSATIHVHVDGAATLLDQTLTASAPATNIAWTRLRFTFTATSATTRLSFQDLSGSDDNASFVDNVAVALVPPIPAVAAVPVPALEHWALLLLAACCAGAGAAVRRARTGK